MREEMRRQDWRDLFELLQKVWQEKILEEVGRGELLRMDEDVFVTCAPEGQPFSLTFFEGKEGLNHYFMSKEAPQIGITPEFSYYSQRCLRCGYRPGKELSPEQLQLAVGMGEGGVWPTAVSFLPGYFPCAPDQREGQRMIKYLGNILQRKIWPAGELPFTTYQFGELELSDDRLLRDLAAASKTETVLQADVAYMGISAKDPQQERAGNPMVYFLTDAGTGRKVNFEILETGKDALLALAGALIRYIMEWGIPRAIRVPNDVVASVLAGICREAGIELKVEKKSRNVLTRDQ